MKSTALPSPLKFARRKANVTLTCSPKFLDLRISIGGACSIEKPAIEIVRVEYEITDDEDKRAGDDRQIDRRRHFGMACHERLEKARHDEHRHQADDDLHAVANAPFERIGSRE